MEQDKRQKKVAGNCALDMCGSIACARIRTTVAMDLKSNYTYEDWRNAEARKHIASIFEYKCTSDCGFQDVCRRLEMAVRHRDLGELEYAIDNRTGNRTERMDIRDAGADDHEADTLEMGAGGICNDYHNECDSAGDGVEDTRMVLWAGAGDLVVRGTNLDNEERRVRIEEVGYWPAEEDSRKFSFSAIEEKALSDFIKQKDKCWDWLFNIPMTQHQIEEALIRDRTIDILNIFFGCNIHDIYDSETLIRMMISEGFKVFSLEGYYKTKSVCRINPLEFRIDAFLDISKIYVYNRKAGVAYNLCGSKMDAQMLKKIIIPLDEWEIKKP